MVQTASNEVAGVFHQGSGIGRNAIAANSIGEVESSLESLFLLYLGDKVSRDVSVKFPIVLTGENLTIKPTFHAASGRYQPTLEAKFEEQAAFFLAQVLSGHNARLNIVDDRLSHVGTNGTRSITTDATLAQIGNGMEKIYGELLRQPSRSAVIG